MTPFGTFAVTTMMVTYWLEPRSRWFTALFSLGCALSSLYAWLAGTYPFFVVEAIWAVVALRRFLQRAQKEADSYGV